MNKKYTMIHLVVKVVCIVSIIVLAISLSGQTNENGYEMISINQEKCVSCGTCYVVCPDYALTVIKKAI